MLELTDVWPLFGLKISSPRLELRLVQDEDLPGIIEAALSGIHDPAAMPFSTPWTDAPKEELMRSTARHQWHVRSGIAPDNWTLNLVVSHEGTPIGMQDIGARDFSIRKTVTTGSWLSSRYQGLGFGKEMRAAVLLFAFDHLGAEVAESSAAVWNHSSLGVSRSLGYVQGSVKRVVTRPGELAEQQEVSVTSAEFKRPDWTVVVTGLEAARKELLGNHAIDGRVPTVPLSR
ncbi:GNAT family N-acetyltransferase [Paeniglutamicibacter kerguelensis]|uniref:RimJ/RimL family protein N-acetyltransferase n=1 Tax=Paeniglutamicibacter kerguelensis TaxID=254788 RepID=A0ABS4XBS1_9MICC|nr:GNAT family N-acetyltransferase [Paeniglutamicibacter kerguelensis]MBP2385920.1 RimJ/RimL family protein N-acetyltransferase [Paeniglutamicibacter kerguelensis]